MESHEYANQPGRPTGARGGRAGVRLEGGTGGGAPVTISGWTCQGYNTPDLLRTGDASQCHTSTAMILAVLPVPTPTAG